MYLNIKTNQIINDKQVRMLHQDKALPSELPPIIGELHKIVQSDKPLFNPDIETIVENGYMENEDGTVSMRYIVQPLSSEQIARNQHQKKLQQISDKVLAFDEQAQSFGFISARELMLAPAAIVAVGPARELQTQIRQVFNTEVAKP